MKYIATMETSRYHPAINHGLIDISDDGFFPDGTPIEDFGAYIVQDIPFPNDQAELDQLFFDFIG